MVLTGIKATDDDKPNTANSEVQLQIVAGDPQVCDGGRRVLGAPLVAGAHTKFFFDEDGLLRGECYTHLPQR